MIRRLLTASLLGGLLWSASATVLSDAEIEGRRLAQELLELTPAENSTNSGVLRIRDENGKLSTVPVECRVTLGETNWRTVYETWSGRNEAAERLSVTHDGANANRYELDGKVIPATNTAVAFASSDFWVVDLGLEFLHWPAQKVLKRNDTRRSRSCTVLESVNPDPSPNGYSRVVSWIDKESGGIVHADAYDANGKRLKEFDPKAFKKVNGERQLQEMRIRNVQTGSRTDLEFILD